MRLWNEAIDIEFPELFSYEDRIGFPELAFDEQGIVIYANNINYSESVLSLNLMVNYCFEKHYFSQFLNIKKAITISLENSAVGQAFTFNLVDPHKRYPESDRDNFSPLMSVDNIPGKNTVCAYADIPLTIEITNPGWGPSLFIYSLLQTHISNTLAIDLTDEAALSSWKNGKKFIPELQVGDDD